jgi:ABC-type nickel/cobalt efflux system permease component RcnA
MRLGVTFAFGLAYFGNQEYFEPIFLSTVFGICNIFARMCTIMSPMVAEVVPEPIILITICAIASAIASSFLRQPQKGDFAGKKGHIAFVQDSDISNHQDENLDQKPIDGVEEIKKELFLLHEDEDDEHEHDHEHEHEHEQVDEQEHSNSNSDSKMSDLTPDDSIKRED